MIAYEALVAPSVQYLAASANGQWIVHPDPLPGIRTASFARRFEIGTPPSSWPVRITAMRQYQLTVNGKARPRVPPENWKTPQTDDLGSLLVAGQNEIRIDVSNPESPPALLVEGPGEVASDRRWTVRTPEDPGDGVAAAVAGRDEAFFADRPNALRTSPYVRGWAITLAVYCLFIFYACLPPSLKPWLARRAAARPSEGTQRAARIGGIACFALFTLVAGIELRNAWVYPLSHGFDSVQHFEYVQHVAAHWDVPLANQGWEMQQPPLYYAAAAGVYEMFGGEARKDLAVRAVQMLSPISAIALLALTWWLLRTLFPSSMRMRVLGFSVAALQPVPLYISTEVTNEVMSALVIDVTLCLAIAQILRGDARMRDALCLGIGCGLGLLSKYTGLFLFLSVLCLAALRLLAGGARSDSPAEATGRRRWPRARQAVWAALLAVTTFVISGWYYLRNYRHFGNAFIVAGDPGSGFGLVQPPGYRTATFVTTFGSVLWQTLARSRNSSFWDGMYGSMWADSHGVFLNRNLMALETLSGLCLWLALLPSVAILLGFGQALRHLVMQDWDHPYFVLVLSAVLMATSMLRFAFERPFYSMLKAHWALWLLPCIAVFAALGLESMCRRTGYLRWLVYSNLAALGCLVLYLFWYRGPWA